MGLIPPSFFWRAIRVTQKKNGSTGGGVLPSSTTVTKDVRSLATYPGIRADQVFKVQWPQLIITSSRTTGEGMDGFYNTHNKYYKNDTTLTAYSPT